MNFNFKIFLIVVFITSKIFSQDCKAPVIISTDDKNSNIYLNNKLFGNGKINIELERGKYFIEIKDSEKKWGSKKIKDTLFVNNCDSIKLSYSFNSFYLETNPEDAYVFKNDSLIGYTPLFISKNYEDNILLSKPGYKSKTISLNDLSDKIINLEFTGEDQGKRFYEKPIFKILVAGIVVLGGTTAYFKLKADDKFEKYQLNGDPHLLDQTKKYDLISGITMGALQINFGILIYYFLTD